MSDLKPKNPVHMNHIEVLNHIGQLNRQVDLKNQENQQLKQRIKQLARERDEAVFLAEERADFIVNASNMEGASNVLERCKLTNSKALAQLKIEQQEIGVNLVGQMLTDMGFDGVDHLCERAVEQLRNRR